MRSEPNGGLKREALERLFEARYNDLGLLLEERAAAAERQRLDAAARAKAAVDQAEQERRDAEARRSKNAAVPFEYAPQPKSAKEINAVVAQGELAVRDYERERRETPDDVLVPRDSLTREVTNIILVFIKIGFVRFHLIMFLRTQRLFHERRNLSLCKVVKPKS